MKNKIISKIMIMTIVLSCMMAFQVSQTFASASTEYLGEIHLMSFNYPPRNWAQCQGQLLSIQQYSALFSLLGTKYGGNGITTFALPNLEAAEPQAGQAGYGMHYCIAIQGIYPPRD